MLGNAIRNVVTALIAALIISTGLFVWEKITDGSLIHALGGVVAEDVARTETGRLQCKAFPTEEFQPQAQCPPDTFKLVEWCSGDCNSDDARVTICCDDRH